MLLRARQSRTQQTQMQLHFTVLQRCLHLLKKCYQPYVDSSWRSIGLFNENGCWVCWGEKHDPTYNSLLASRDE